MALPLLLESFPLPPTTSPLPSPLPQSGPSGPPPSAPLPPTPGPSTITDHVLLSHKFRASTSSARSNSPDVPALLSDSDSSIDLHTPLPHIMLRHGLLSPNSKLLTPSRPVSVASNTDSLMTRSGVIKDSRDTPSRRVRHRDGTLLRGGIGLTTGLGWSDSEDEDAPSALTRKISSLNLSRRSTPSLRSSFSRSTVFDEDDIDELTTNSWSRHSSFSSRSKTPSRIRAPPTAWSKKSTSTSRSSLRSSSASSASLALSIPSQESLVPSRVPKQNDEIVRTPSTSSSLSITLPVTPQDDAPISHTQSKYLHLPDRDKMLPSLPNPRTGSIRRYASHANLNTPSTTSLPTPRPISNSRRRSQSSASSPGHETHSLSTTVSPRSLRLPIRPDSVPVPPLPTSLSSRTTPSTSNYGQTTFKARPRISDPGQTSSISPLPAGIPVPRKPRTGTGMVYRSGPSTTRRLVTSPASSTIGLAL